MSAGPTPGAPAWADPELTNPHASADKPEKVRRMFAAIARSYDLNNRLHSFGQDQRWRRFAVRAAGVREGDFVLDVACGTGDLTRAFARARPSPARVVGLDFTQEMLDIAEEKRRRATADTGITYLRGDAQNLPFPAASFDVLSIAFGIRNVGDPASAVREFQRVLRPGGRLVILEFDRPRFAPLRWLSDVYTRRIMPFTATLISRDRSGAYRYLPRSVETFLDRDQLAALLRASGFAAVRSTPLSFGICVCHVAHKAAPPHPEQGTTPSTAPGDHHPIV
jgi:demethylmenaquinone methyltransferase/2-methoxy-6-polyprenyl-1,4-benzoquinol methylase